MADSQIGKAVLLVDDSRMDLANMMNQLNHAGCAVRTTDSHDCALKLIVDDQGIGIVILDHGITGKSVADFITVAKTIRPELIIVGSSSSDCRRQFDEAGADCFLRKPWRIAELIELLKATKPSDFGGSAGSIRSTTGANQASSVTRLGNDNSDTMCMRFSVGDRARVAVGKMEGLEGIVSGSRSGGRILLQVKAGVFVEIHQYVLERVNLSQTRPEVKVRNPSGKSGIGRRPSSSRRYG